MKRSEYFESETNELPRNYRAPIYGRLVFLVFRNLTGRAFDDLNETIINPFRFPTWPVAAALLLLSAVLALAMVVNPAGPEKSAKIFLNVMWVSIAVVAFGYLFVGLQNAWRWVGSGSLHMIVVFMVYAVIGLGVFNGLTTVAPWTALAVIWMMAYLMLLANWLGAHLILALVRKRVAS